MPPMTLLAASRAKVQAALIVCALLMFAANTSLSQSGRRPPKRGPSPAVTQPTPAPTPVAKVKPAQPQFSLLVVGDIPETLYLSFPFPERVQTWVAKRLRDSSALAVMEGERINRKEAIKRAKTSKEVFVIWVQLNENVFGPPVGTGDVRSSMDNLRVNYSIYSPSTGQAKASGVVFLNPRTSIIDLGGVRTGPTCYPNVRGKDYVLLEASLEVANRIMHAFNLPPPPVCP